MGDPELGEAEERRLRRSRTAAAFGFILLATSLLLPWWTIRLTGDGDPIERVDIRLWDEHFLARAVPQWASAILAGVALFVLFVRIAAASWRHEPPAWRRDVAIAFAMVAAALVLVWLWPTGDAGTPSFWDTTLASDGETRFVQRSMPGLGWWAAATSAATLGAAALLGRKPAGEPAEGAPPTTEK